MPVPPITTVDLGLDDETIGVAVGRWDVDLTRIPVSHTFASVARMSAQVDCVASLAARARDASNDARCSTTSFGEQSEEVRY